MELSSGICLPSSCSSNDVKEISDYAVSKFNFHVTSVRSDSNSILSFRVKILAIFIFSILLIVVISSSIYELYSNYKESKIIFSYRIMSINLSYQSHLIPRGLHFRSTQIAKNFSMWKESSLQDQFNALTVYEQFHFCG